MGTKDLWQAAIERCVDELQKRVLDGSGDQCQVSALRSIGRESNQRHSVNRSSRVADYRRRAARRSLLQKVRRSISLARNHQEDVERRVHVITRKPQELIADLDATVAEQKNALNGFTRAVDFDFTNRVIEEAQKLFPRVRVWDADKARMRLGDRFTEIGNALREAARGGFNARKSAVSDAKEALALCLQRLEPSGGLEWYQLDEVWESSYATQGFGAALYAQKAAESRANSYCEGSSEIEIRVEKVNGLGAYIIAARVASTLDARIVKARKRALPIREWVRRCWARGVNPRVYQPSLPHDFERKNQLDYFGNDLSEGD